MASSIFIQTHIVDAAARRACNRVTRGGVVGWQQSHHVKVAAATTLRACEWRQSQCVKVAMLFTEVPLGRG
ncbi:hypothetical protein GYH30_014652 [Glycine max]|nr:hypothetical protein GYH30_014652 [Glycine max]